MKHQLIDPIPLSGEMIKQEYQKVTLQKYLPNQFVKHKESTKKFQNYGTET